MAQAPRVRRPPSPERTPQPQPQPQRALPGSRANQDVRCVPVATAVIGLGSLTAECRQQVNTPCRMPLHALAYMDVQETFFGSFWRPPKGTRLPGRDPATWQSTASPITDHRSTSRRASCAPIFPLCGSLVGRAVVPFAIVVERVPARHRRMRVDVDREQVIGLHQGIQIIKTLNEIKALTKRGSTACKRFSQHFLRVCPSLKVKVVK
jgi:hypothetical protein